jgi:hypothetical protein
MRMTLERLCPKAYDPDQPRQPKGDPEGGQWTETGAGGGAGGGGSTDKGEGGDSQNGSKEGLRKLKKKYPPKEVLDKEDNSHNVPVIMLNDGQYIVSEHSHGRMLANVGIVGPDAENDPDYDIKYEKFFKDTASARLRGGGYGSVQFFADPTFKQIDSLVYTGRLFGWSNIIIGYVDAKGSADELVPTEDLMRWYRKTFRKR